MSDLQNTPPRIAAILPVYRERDHILDVLSAMPPAVTQIFCVDDGCPDKTGDRIEEACTDPRVTVLRHARNQGVGAAMVTGYRAALDAGADILVKIDGDGQMPAALIPTLVRQIVDGDADFVKGNRFYRPQAVAAMPTGRLVGNAILSFMNKISSGYWQVFDPTNGFTAVHARVLRSLPLDRLNCGYLFETEMLFRLSTIRAVVRDIPMPTIYGAETSHLVPHKLAWPLLKRHTGNFGRRLVYSYFLRDFSVASLEWGLGPVLLLWGIGFGLIEWQASVESGQAATAGTVMVAALPIIVGTQLLLSALNFDIANQPRVPIHPSLSEDDPAEDDPGEDVAQKESPDGAKR